MSCTQYNDQLVIVFIRINRNIRNPINHEILLYGNNSLSQAQKVYLLKIFANSLKQQDILKCEQLKKCDYSNIIANIYFSPVKYILQFCLFLFILPLSYFHLLSTLSGSVLLKSNMLKLNIRIMTGRFQYIDTTV